VGARDDEDRADEHRHTAAQIAEEQRRGDRDPERGDHDPDEDEPRDERPDVGPDLVERQPQPGLEEDHAHGHGHERLVERPEQHGRLHVLREDPRDEGHREEHDDRRQAQEPGGQLRADREPGHQPEPEQGVVGAQRRGHGDDHPAPRARGRHLDRVTAAARADGVCVHPVG
jgi:hypothetical protein